MPKIPGVSQRAAIAALQKAGFQIIRQGVDMSDGVPDPHDPRHNPINTRWETLQAGRLHARRIPQVTLILASSDVPISAFLRTAELSEPSNCSSFALHAPSSVPLAPRSFSMLGASALTVFANLIRAQARYVHISLGDNQFVHGLFTK
jgi:hypothetical protein